MHPLTSTKIRIPEPTRNIRPEQIPCGSIGRLGYQRRFSLKENGSAQSFDATATGNLL